MLLPRSKCIFKALLVWALFVSAVSQNYDGEYDDDDHSSYESESDGPDYSKYYSGSDGGSSAALVDVKSNTGFVNPAEFSSFFSPSFYAASNKQEVTKDTNNGFVNSQDFQSGFADFRASPFGGKDFFEQAAQLQNAQKTKPEANDNYELKPGPSYVSHKIVPPAPKKSKYETEIDDLNKQYNYKTNENHEEKVIPQYSGGKQKIVEPKFVPQYTPINPKNLTPYQKYSFQTQSKPATLSTFASASTGKLTTAPVYANYDYLYNPSTNNDYKLAYDAAASNVNSKFQEKLNDFKPSPLIKECKKVNKHVPGTSKNSKPMDCYVCKDAKGISYEECFYGQTSESNPKNFYIESSKEYTEPTQVQTYNFNRYKRYTVNDNSKDDPYEYLKKQSEKYYNSPDFGSSYKHPKSFEDDYRYGGADEAERSSSEQVADQLVKSGEHCRKVDKDGMTCTICENKKTGGNYEQCSYSTAPEEKKYAYSKQRKYNQEPTEETDSSEEQPISNKKPQQFYKSKKETPKKQRYQQKQRGVKPNRNDDTSDEVERIKPANTHRQVSEYTVPKHFANIHVSPESAESEDEQPDHDEYYYPLPSQASESKRDEQRRPTEESDHESAEEEESPPEEHYGYYGEESKKDVEEVLAEFAKKDRSKCKKAEKNGMTCYLCIDKKGLQHEECMYVSESRPQSKYQAYHAQKETDGSEGATPQNRNEENVEESKVKSVRASRLEPHSAETKYPAIAESTTESVQPQRRNRPKKAVNSEQKSRIARRTYSERIEDAPTVDESKDEGRVYGERGAFSHETEPVYSKKFGVTLPKFMLTKSEGEKDFDEFVNAKS